MSRRSIPRNVIVVAFVAFWSGLSQEMVTPLLPAYFAALGFSTAAIGLIDGAVNGAANFAKVVAGYLSDRFRNRKWFVFLGYALSAAARPALGFVSGLAPLAGARVLDGIGKGIKDGPRDALIADAAGKKASGRGFGFHRVVDTAGSVIGPLVAAAVVAYSATTAAGREKVFLLTAIPGAIVLALIVFGVREPAKAAPKKGRAAIGRLPPLFWWFTLISFVAVGSRMADALLLLRSRDFGVPAVFVPLLYSLFHLVYAGLAYPVGVWSDRVGKLPMLIYGWLLLGFVQLGFSFSDGRPWMAAALFAAYGLVFALTEGTNRAWISELVPANARATAYGIFNAALGLAAICAGVALGTLWDAVAPGFAFLLSSLGAFLAAGLYLGLNRRLKKAV